MIMLVQANQNVLRIKSKHSVTAGEALFEKTPQNRDVHSSSLTLPVSLMFIHQSSVPGQRCITHIYT